MGTGVVTRSHPSNSYLQNRIDSSSVRPSREEGTSFLPLVKGTTRVRVKRIPSWGASPGVRTTYRSAGTLRVGTRTDPEIGKYREDSRPDGG